MAMDARKQRILEAIVALYATDGEPVGSGLLASYFDMALSSATLRNEMAALTKLGLLEQPHTSAGRVPSSKGYRYYLDHLIEAPGTTSLGEEDRAAIDRLFASMDVEPEKLAQSTARALADYTGCAAAATTPQAEDLCIAHFEVVQVGRYSAAVLAVTSAGGVRTRVARINTGLTRTDAEQLAQLLNRSLTFVAPEDLSPSLTAGLAMAAGQRLLPVVLAAEALVRTRPQVSLEGAQYLAKMPDVRTNLGTLLEIFSDNEAACDLIEPDGGKITATLGDDLDPPMPNCCIVSKRYLAGGGLHGTVAVIGSNRMEYQRLIPILNYFAIKLGQSMSGKKEEQI
ncbi:MAG: heat-inducible transcriptional repressor HrcA [Gemmiger sp.]|uniref:heat-inducible transcriptional repressor HrcA n=1 Tax=Gemmiger sp. TaxID=2049027 RepID=UPI002E790125|nr:heat-inducible transcriptional repressor HrcA [Gemmiger sp.]MEE0800892.1 heat-inducible transcriptional repressor HrcA [Gemmiger sp.]